MSTPGAQRRADFNVHVLNRSLPSPDAALGDGDGAARHPYLFYGTERMRQKLFWVGSGVLVKRSAP
jgi:hypothetical protein